MVMDFNHKFNYWKNSLLDLGKRNKLINFKETKRSTITINNPDMYLLWDRIVIKGEKISFPSDFNFFDSTYDEEIDSGFEEDKNDKFNILYNDDIVTNQTVKELQQTLRNIKLKAKISKEEMGINTLYLAFGFLKYKERKEATTDLLAPLVLVPIQIELENLQSPYTFSILEGEDIVINPALSYKLISDFGIDINSDISEESLTDYIKFVESKIRNTSWNVEKKANIALFSFYKISMYNDLINNKCKVEKSQIMQLVIGNAKYNQEIPDYLNNIDYDKDIKVKDSFLIMDADSSQLDAIEYAKNGISFVLQGPPGTGKSQTITNMIAELIAHGKKVLFVSSKMAALEVVYNRMQKAKLSEFCLSLHNPKANKKEILKQLNEVLELSKKKFELANQAKYNMDKLQFVKDEINSYTEELHKVRKPFNRSIYQVNGEIAKASNVEDIIFDFESISEIAEEDFNRILYSIEEYERTIVDNTLFWNSSCWKHLKDLNLNNEMRHNINFYLNNMHRKLKEFNNDLIAEQNRGNIRFEINFNKIDEMISILNRIDNLKEIPSYWFETDDLNVLYVQAKRQREIELEINNKNMEIKELLAQNKMLNIEESNKNFDKYELEKKIESDELFTKLEKLAATEQEDLINSLVNYLKEYESLKKVILKDFDDEILRIEFHEILKRYKSGYNNPFKVFNKNYREDRKIFMGLRTDIRKKIKDAEIIDTLQILEMINNLRESNAKNISKWKSVYGSFYNGEDTDISMLLSKYEIYRRLVNIRSIFREIEKLKKEQLEDEKLKLFVIRNNDLLDWNEILNRLDEFIKLNDKVKEEKLDISIIYNLYNNKNKTDIVQSIIRIFNTNKNIISKDIDWINDLFENEDLYRFTSIELYKKIDKCIENIDLLEKYLDYVKAKKKCDENGLSDFITKIESVEIKSNNILPIFKKRFYRLWLDSIEDKCEVIKNFRKEIHEKNIKEFKKLDEEEYKTNQARILSNIVSNFPNFERLSNGNDEISILKKELNKSKKIMSLRRLFKTIPNLILTLKPCLMMSPLSVSIFLDCSKYEFDTVIFDEASQIKTEDAIGAIIRGRQVIIVGDNKQLPPTNFFNISISDDDDDYNEEEENDMGAYESILDEASLLPEKTLLWHYRSKNESLIVFSNAKFYNNKLITFPSNTEKLSNNGVEFIYVENGRYDRGGRKGNVNEAKKVAQLVFEHFTENPSRSLGVITFGEIQQYAIENELNKMRMENPTFEKFFLEDNEEAFFVKNLENVQGDERDTIIFSIGYAKDLNGKMNMNFGPLSRIGGERRLNVAITRAKYNIKLVSSILSTDINVDSVNTDGPKLLKRYIEFAKNGIEALKNELSVNERNYFDSPFEESVYNFLVRNGYNIRTQIGCSGYRIDIAVQHPKNKDLYILGIECDGATYHSTRTARERDRLRQDILENMGWKIYRIWSTDWIKNRDKEEKSLIYAIQKAIEDFGLLPLKEEDNSKKEDNEEYLKVTKKDIFNPYELEYYTEYQYNYFSNSGNISQILDDVIKTEYPIHFDEICRRISMYYNSTSATKKVKESVRYELYNIREKYFIDNEFYMPLDAKMRARCNYSYNNSYGKDYIIVGNKKINNHIKDIKYLPIKRQIKYIHVREIALIMEKIKQKSINIDMQSLFEETAKVLNTRVSSNYDKFIVAYNLNK